MKTNKSLSLMQLCVDRTYINLNSEFVDNQYAHGQIEIDETGELIYSENTEPTEQNSQVHESNWH